jgi:hypothetical protein
MTLAVTWLSHALSNGDCNLTLVDSVLPGRTSKLGEEKTNSMSKKALGSIISSLLPYNGLSSQMWLVDSHATRATLYHCDNTCVSAVTASCVVN